MSPATPQQRPPSPQRPQVPAPPPRVPWLSWVALLALTGLLVGQGLLGGLGQQPPWSYTAFRAAVEAGRVAQVTLTPDEVRLVLRPEGDAKEGVHYRVVRVEDPGLLEALRAHGVEVRGEVPAGVWALMLPWLLGLGLLAMVWGRAPGGLPGAGPRAAHFTALRAQRVRVDVDKAVKVSFADVAGVDEAKEELQEVVDFLREPERFRKVGGRLPRGVLLVGPPGTGKTLLARAVAGEAQVPFFRISGSEFVELFVGVGAARVRDLFEQARAEAPCIVFIDELDALGRSRTAGPTGGGSDEREQTLNQLLVELDGFDAHAGVVLMAATNRPEILDPALLRAGRFDRQVLVDRPDRAGRLAILKVHARGVALEREADLEGVAAQTPGMAGADMANLLNEAALLAVRRRKETVGRAELEEAVERVLAGLQKKGRVLTPQERERVAFHEVGHALAARLLPGAMKVKKLSIVPRGMSALGYTWQEPSEERSLLTRAELEARLAQLLAGRVAELLVLGEASTGAADDLARATALARSMVESFGMSDALGPVSYDARPAGLVGAGPPPPVSEEVARHVDAEVRHLLFTQQERVRGLLEQRRELLQRAAQRLLAQEVLSGEELEELLGEDGGMKAA